MQEVTPHTMIVDTYRLIKTLKSRGFTEEQAQGITEAINEIDLSSLATKADVADLQTRMESEFAAVRAEMKTQSAELKADIFKWIVPLMLGQAGLITALVKLL